MTTFRIIILALAAFGLASFLAPVLLAIWEAGRSLVLPLTLAAAAALLYTGARVYMILRETRRPGRVS